MKIIEWLQSGKVIIGDGALGTQLQLQSETPVELPETFCLDSRGQELVRQVHASYFQAGARILETNTFAANPWCLGLAGLEQQCEQINRTAVSLTRSVAGHDAAVVGSVGPLGLGLAVRDFSESQLREFYRVQMSVLADSGVDGLCLETFNSVTEARVALAEARVTNLPFFFMMGGLAICQPYARRTVLDLIKLAEEYGASAIGFNCVPPYDLSEVLPVLAQRTSLPLMAYPNAGTPTVQRGLVRYDLPTAVLLGEARNWYHAGATIFGGCCGTSPEHIQALCEEFAGCNVFARSRPTEIEVTVPKPLPAVAQIDNPIRSRLIEGKKPLIAVEIRPSLSRPLRQTIELVGKIAEAGPDFFDVPDNPGANPGRDCLVCAYLLQQRFGIPVIIHKSATQTNSLQLHSYLLGASEMGIRGVLAVTGDPPHVGPFDRWASRVSDVKSSVELLRLLALLRAGELLNGQPLPEPVDFAAGCAYAPMMNLAGQTQWLRRKIEAGAEYVFTQPIYRMEDFEQMTEATSDLKVPIFVGVLPLTSVRQLAYLRSGKIPGILVPDSIASQIERYEKPESQASAGMELAERFIDDLTGRADGIYLIMPFHKDGFSLTERLVKRIAAKRTAQ